MTSATAPVTRGGMYVVLALLGLLAAIWTCVSWLNRRDRPIQGTWPSARRPPELPPQFDYLANPDAKGSADAPEQ